MDIEIIVIGISILALILSIFVFIDNLKKTKIMNKQFEILQEQTESKKEIRNAIKTVSKVQEMISKISKRDYDWGDFGSIAYLRLLEILHDSGKKMIKWKIWPMYFLGEFFAASLTEWNNFESFLNIFEKKVADSNSKLNLQFISKPKIETSPGVDVSNIELRDYFKDIYSLRIAYSELDSIKKVINLYDISLADDISILYLKILKALHERLLSGYEYEISIDLKTKELPEYLLRFISYDIWKDCIKDLNDNIIPRLYEVQKHMLEIV